MQICNNLRGWGSTMPNTTKANSLKCILIEPNIPDRNLCEGEIRLNRSYLTVAVRFCFVSFLTKLSEIRFFVSFFFVTFFFCFANVFSCGKTL